MVKITVPSVLLVGALLQLVEHCSASGPVHIHLSLDGSTDQRYEEIKNQFQHNVKDLRDTSLADIKNTVKGRHIRLYISGDFAQKTPTDPHSDLFWDSGAKNAKYIADIVSKMFKDDAIVIVVFPKITQLFCGFEFLETFEQEIQKSHKDISIGREKMYFYFFLDDEKKNAEIELFTFPHEEYKRISIAANKQLDLYNFASKEWSNGVDSISQVLIYEADTVEIRLESKCDDKDSKFTVAGHLPKSLANELLKAVKAEGHNHPYQTLRVKLPKVCGTDTQRSEFTEELINILREEELDIYGKEPSAVIQFASVYPKNDDFVGHAMKKMEGVKKEYGNIRQYLAMFDHNNIVMTKEGQSITNIKTELSDIKELSIQVHCHGHFVKSQNYVCGLDANTLAAKLRNSQIVKEISSIQIIFYACNVGTQKGQKFVLTFLDNLEGIHIHEVISFKSWVQQSDEEVQILVARQDNFKATTIIDEKEINEDNKILTGNLNDPVDILNTLGAKWENYVFGRFTTRIKNKNSFAVLPKTELKL